MQDNLRPVIDKFFAQRNATLWNKFPGQYRAVVTETNDPLDMHRVRVKCPELHNFNLLPDDCPWAVPSFDLGTKRSGRWSYPCIGDWVWIVFEKGHPYGIIWVGFADPTRRKFYALPSIFNISPLPVDASGDPEQEAPIDYNLAYLPKDGRPMSHGWCDRYGNVDIHSAVGFFPTEHKNKPPAPDRDAIQAQQLHDVAAPDNQETPAFRQQGQPPEMNDPDVKHMTRVTKYGHILSMGDQGYWWKKEETQSAEDAAADASLTESERQLFEGDSQSTRTEIIGEFEGDFDNDEQFEIDRWKYLQKLINENSTTQDQRKIKILTRYGHLFEMRDTGWAQKGPMPSKSRQDEYGDPRYLSDNTIDDHRWIKIRSKLGHLIQLWDTGSDPQEDEFIKRKLIDEVGPKADEEDAYWKDKDARQIRFVTRHGFKIVLFDAGSDPKKARELETPRGTGILFKTRRSPGNDASSLISPTGDPRGFHFEMNDTDEQNHMIWGSPNGQIMEINDQEEYQAICSRVNQFFPAWKHVKENEFGTGSLVNYSPLSTTHHLFLDHRNEFISLKTRGGQGDGPFRTDTQSAASFQQGFEARDGAGSDGPWVELVDTDKRGMWFSRDSGLGIWRAKDGSDMDIFMDDSSNDMVLRNDSTGGMTQLWSGNDVQIKSGGTVTIIANKIHFKAETEISLQAGGAGLTLFPQAIGTNMPFVAPEIRGFFPQCQTGGGAGSPEAIPPPPIAPITQIVPPKREPTDRGSRSENFPVFS